ncbi:hypothetical protein CROQUDRAFT_663395 [Cronartium quercuum f. sp. fusiforme G11]|uniref:DUF218 domain-containing protein n=1 Tax=Cronartium quercuum f. sp. fusiforme G11 TaxID=708437 RepID=A0A9P6NCK4_9BASI|nr:hypothetical protein CROQUDRAFT_663395 [Cronartium quercuum f. sp. fusiforme G11]
MSYAKLSSSTSTSLPTPVTATTSNHSNSNPLYSLINTSSHSRSNHHWSSFLLARARTTNLAVIILSLICSLSLYINFKHSFLLSSSESDFKITTTTTLTSIQSTLPPPPIKGMKTLIILPGHAIFVGTDPENPTHWILEPYQDPISSIKTFLNQIKKAASLVLKLNDSLLIYSGGQTRKRSKETTEANSYSKIAHLLNLYNETNIDEPFKRFTTEEFALDSWTNLLFSVARFKEYTGNYPISIKIIGHDYKSKRFVDIHRKALRWPKENFEYIGIKTNTVEDLDLLNSLYKGEKKVYDNFLLDTYGCKGNLILKRKFRNPFRRFHPYVISCPELIDLFEWCPSNGIGWFDGPLPWKTNSLEN